jgi:hypothetical protein
LKKGSIPFQAQRNIQRDSVSLIDRRASIDFCYPSNDVPLPCIQANAIREALQFALQPGDPVYLISKNCFTQWSRYSGFARSPSPGLSPGPIDNSNLYKAIVMEVWSYWSRGLGVALKSTQMAHTPEWADSPGFSHRRAHHLFWWHHPSHSDRERPSNSRIATWENNFGKSRPDGQFLKRLVRLVSENYVIV